MRWVRVRQWLVRMFSTGRSAEIDAEADRLIAEHGAGAYEVARENARATPRGGSQHRYWSKMASRIAERTGRDIGVTGADRYPGP